ncbi:MAG: glycosyltransferase [Candidatus Hodarchaeales archaeon]
MFTDIFVPNINGVTISIINEIKTLKKEGHEIVLVTQKLNETTPYKMNRVPIVKIRSFPIPNYPGYSLALVDSEFNKAMKKYKLDIIHSHGPFSAGWLALFAAKSLNKCPLVNTYHTDLVKYSGHLIGGFQAEKFSKGFAGAVWWFINLYYNRSDVVVKPSKTLQHDLIAHGLKPPVYSLPNMISDVFFNLKITQTDLEEFGSSIRKKFSIPENHRIITYCGRVSFEKKLEIVLEGFKDVKKSHRDVTLLIIGDGPHLKAYRKQAEKLGLQNVVFTGFVTHTKLPYYYQMGEFMVTPSDTETQGLTVIEAMSQSKPVIGVNEGGVKDYIEDYTNGILVEPNNVEEFKKAILYLLDNPSEAIKMGNVAKTSAMKYSPEGFSVKLNKTFEIAFERYNL